MIRSNSSKRRNEFKSIMDVEKCTLWIGKSGITNQLMDEVIKQLEKREVIKIRILKSALKNEDASSIIQRITKETDSTLIDKRGNVFTLFKPKKRKKPL